MAVMSFCSLDSYSKCHWHNGRPPLASFDHPCCVREVLVWILGGRRGALDNRQSPHPFLEESALTGNLKFTFKWFISFNSFTEAVHSLKCVRKTRVRFFLYQHLRRISESERERAKERWGPTLSSLLFLPDPSFSCAAHHTCTSRHCDGHSRWYWNVLLLRCIKKATQKIKNY